jgi:hypothetical protein
MKVNCIASLAFLFAGVIAAQNGAPTGGESLKALSFLEGTWEAKTGGGAAGASVAGSFTFVLELGGHVLARHSKDASCKGPADFDCEHRDLLYVYQDAPGQPLKAIYFDSEGHVIQYGVSTPTATSAVFLSDSAAPGPQFRLMYEKTDGIMSGKFQMHMPGQTEWKSYLEWSGAKK